MAPRCARRTQYRDPRLIPASCPAVHGLQ